MLDQTWSAHSSFQSNGWTAAAPSITSVSSRHRITLSTSLQNYAFCPAGRSTHTCSDWCPKKSRRTSTNPSIFHGQVCQETFSMERCIVPIWSRAVTNISEYTPPSDLLAQLQNWSEVKTINDDLQDSNSSTALLKVGKCVAKVPNTAASVSFTSSNTGLVYMAPHTNLTRY